MAKKRKSREEKWHSRRYEIIPTGAGRWQNPEETGGYIEENEKIMLYIKHALQAAVYGSSRTSARRKAAEPYAQQVRGGRQAGRFGMANAAGAGMLRHKKAAGNGGRETAENKRTHGRNGMKNVAKTAAGVLAAETGGGATQFKKQRQHIAAVRSRYTMAACENENSRQAVVRGTVL